MLVTAHAVARGEGIGGGVRHGSHHGQVRGWVSGVGPASVPGTSGERENGVGCTPPPAALLSLLGLGAISAGGSVLLATSSQAAATRAALTGSPPTPRLPAT